MNDIRKGYIRVIESIQQAKEVWAALGVIVIGVVGVMGYLSTNFLTAQAAEISHKEMARDLAEADRQMATQIKNLTIEVSQTNSLLSLHMDKHSLDAINLAIQSNETEIFNLEQIIRKDGTNTEASRRLVKLKGQREELSIRRGCIISGNPRCD
jgi:hypothetical protein